MAAVNIMIMESLPSIFITTVHWKQKNNLSEMSMMKLISIPVLMLCIGSAKAQTAEAMQKIFPDKLAVFSSINKKVEIAFKNGVPYAEANQVSEMMILDDRANGMFNKDRVYHSSFNELKKIEAYTLVPDGSNMKKIKVNDFKTQSSPSSSVFYDDSQETGFDYPKMLKGSIAHVETDYYNKDIRFLSPFYFSSYLPVYNAAYSITFPDDMEVKYIIKNDDKKSITVTESKKGRKKKLEFTANTITNYQHFDDGTSVTYYAPHVLVYVNKYKGSNGDVPVFNSVDDLYKWNASFLKDVNVKPDAQLKAIADSLCAGKKTDWDKAAAIFNWVQSHIKYVAFEQGLEGFIPRQAADVCLKRYGDCKDMASLLTAMLTASGVTARFTWIGTRSIPYTYTEVPLPFTDNHMICAAYIDGKPIFLDATDPNCIFGFPSSGIQDKQALIAVNPDKYELVTVPIMPASKSTIVDSTYLNINGNVLTGNSVIKYKGYFGNDVYNSLLYNKGEDEKIYVRNRVKRGNNKFTLKDYTINRTNPSDKEVSINAAFEIGDYVKSLGDEIYVNLNAAKLFYGTPIDTAARKVAMENNYLYTVQENHILNIPEGYIVDYVPKNINLPGNVVSLSIEYKQMPGKIIATQNYTLSKLYITPQDFAEWNSTLTKAMPAYKEQVVLKKK